MGAQLAEEGNLCNPHRRRISWCIHPICLFSGEQTNLATLYLLTLPPPIHTGRNFLRCWHGRAESLLEVVAINDSGGVKQASHLVKYDSILGTFDAVRGRLNKLTPGAVQVDMLTPHKLTPCCTR